MHALSTWAASVPAEISQATALSEKTFAGFDISILHSQTALWIVATRKNGFRIAFRALYTFGSFIDSVKMSSEQEELLNVGIASDLGKFEIAIAFEQAAPILRYTVSFTPKQPLCIPFSPRDIFVFGKDEGKIHVAQQGTRSGHLFFSTADAGTSILYWQNLSALSEYCQSTQTSAGGTVGGTWPELGFELPASAENPLEAHKKVVISDAFVLLSETAPKKDAEIAKAYIDYLSEIYLLLPKPDTAYNDWLQLATKGLSDLKDNKGCWTQAGGKSYLNAYVCDYDTPPEIMVQLAVLVPLNEYFAWLGEKDAIADDLHDGLERFYDEDLKTISRWLPSLKHRLDQSEEQKKEDVMDSWYLHHPLMNLARLALWKDKDAKELLLKSIDYAIKVAHHFKYDWPVFYEMDTLIEVKPDRIEKDVPGAYANLMLQMRDLTGDEKYFKEALKAADQLISNGLSLFYQANNTAFSAATMLRIYKETGKKKYLDATYLCLFGLFKNMQLWDGKYGYAQGYSRFFAIYPLSDAPYIAPYEELEVFAALHYLLDEAQEIELMPSARLLISEFIRYFVFRMPFYYPQYLPKEAISEDVKTGEIDPSLWIPLEDLRDGWEKSGQVGQEVYGAAGAGFGVVPRQYFKLEHDLLLFVDYPIAKLRKSKNAVTFQINGDGRLKCKIRLLGKNISGLKLVVSETKANFELKTTGKDKDWLEFSADGNAKIRISWN